jgi:hypothetical protein
MSNNAENEDVNLSIYGDGRLELEMSLNQYNEINLSALDLAGATLSSLAETDSSRAYSLIKRMVGSFAIHANSIAVNGVLVVNKEDDGEAATRSIARNALSSRMPESYERRIEFSLGVRMSDADAQMFGESQGKILSVLDFVIEPPNYTN